MIARIVPRTYLNAIDGSCPVTHDKPLEIELLFHETGEQLAVLACLRLVDLVVRAPASTVSKEKIRIAAADLHDTAYTSLDSLGKRPGIDFVNSAIIEVGTINLG